MADISDLCPSADLPSDATYSVDSDISIYYDSPASFSFGMASPQSLLPDSPPVISSTSVSSPSSSSEHSTAAPSKKSGGRSSKSREKKYKELSPILKTDESMRLPSGKYQCPWIEDGVACLQEEDIPRDLKYVRMTTQVTQSNCSYMLTSASKHLRWHQNPVLCPWRENEQAPCNVRKPWPRDMDRHVEIHHTSRKGVDSKYKCRVCRKGFARRDHLTRHKKNAICRKQNRG